MADLPLSALLSQTLVAFTVEFDNEFEHRMPHCTTEYGATPGATDAPWLVSMAMWIHCMRHVPEEGITAVDLARRAQLSAKATEMILKRMSRWWGYLRIAPGAGDTGAEPRRSAWVVRPTRAGRRARRVWEPLTAEISDRWRARFGGADIDALLVALNALDARFDAIHPDFLPIGEQARGWRVEARSTPAAEADAERASSLPALLSRLLYAYALEFDAEADPPLALGANVLRVLGPDGVPVSRLPSLTGIAGMGVDNSLSVLNRRGLVSVGSGRSKLATPTATGRPAREAYASAVAKIERVWERRFSVDLVGDARRSLERVVGGGTAVDSPLFEGLEPYPDGWRAQVQRPDTLPHFPMVSHRGGYPDGS